MAQFYDLSETARFSIYGGLDALQCQSIGGSGDKFTVAVAKGKLGELLQFMKSKGLEFIDMHYFPLGSDKPAEILRHDSMAYGVKACNWLYANFKVSA